MGLLKKIGDFFAGAGGNIIDTIGDTVDRFITNPDERNALKLEIKRLDEEHRQNQRRFLLEMEELTQKRESEIEETIRTELDAQKEIIVAELKQDDKYTKRARPTVVYVGLFFILLEVFGLRHLILNSLDLGNNALEIIESSDSIFKVFLAAWAGVVGVYAVGRSVEKRGTRVAWTSGDTGPNSGNIAKAKEQELINKVKTKLKDIKW
ncbi:MULTISPECIES: 3TM-type holin [unclassified Saccharicrinis]|uniref:3TM-type holin n=1 Tax=unclassified Saccharicrinis TaxID=2646859 RepID=UPI003D3594C8